tara:strand:- start:103 stop:357 length:255 start_codon:yes stop_codon:yes gene_type:complete
MRYKNNNLEIDYDVLRQKTMELYDLLGRPNFSRCFNLGKADANGIRLKVERVEGVADECLELLLSHLNAKKFNNGFITNVRRKI